MEYTFLSATVLLVLITDPLGNIPLFISAMRDVPREREDEAPRQLGGRRSRAARAAQRDTSLVRRRDVDRGVARAATAFLAAGFGFGASTEGWADCGDAKAFVWLAGHLNAPF